MSGIQEESRDSAGIRSGISSGDPVPQVPLPRHGSLIEHAIDSEWDRVEVGKMFRCRFGIPHEIRDLGSFMAFRSALEKEMNTRLEMLFEGKEEPAVKFKATWAINELLPNIFEHAFLGLGKDEKNALREDPSSELHHQAALLATERLNDPVFNLRIAEVTAGWEGDGGFLITVRDTGNWRGFEREARAEVECFDNHENLEVHGQNGLGVLIAFAPQSTQDPITGLITVPIRND